MFIFYYYLFNILGVQQRAYWENVDFENITACLIFFLKVKENENA